MNEERLLKQMQAIRQLDERLEGIRLLAGIEVNILADGRLDLPDGILSVSMWSWRRCIPP